MSTLYLHIGTPKTGTSAIQRFLPMNEELLKEQGFCYPDLGYRFSGIGKNRNAHFLVYRQRCISETEEETQRIRQLEDEYFYKGLDKIKEIMNIYPNVILSDENIWNGYVKRENFWETLNDALSERGINLKVIVYLRRQDLVIESYWIQRVKEMLQMSFQDYISSGKYKYFKLDYYKQLKYIAEIIGKENIIVRAYEKQQYEGSGNTLISDFLNILGLKMNPEYVSADIVANTSLFGGCLEVKRILNQMECFQKPNWSVRYLRIIQEELENQTGLSVSECRYFKYEQQMAFLSEYDSCNSAVAREFMNREDGILFREEISKRIDNETRYSNEELVLICGRMLELQNQEMNLKINDMQDKIDKLKNSLAWANRPLYRKIGGRIYHILKNK